MGIFGTLWQADGVHEQQAAQRAQGTLRGGIYRNLDAKSATESRRQVVALQSRSVDKLVVDHLDIGSKMIIGVSWSQLKLW